MNMLSLCGIVVTYHPDADVTANLVAIAAECGRAIVVDNGSSAADTARLASVPGVELISLPENVGVAAGLNTGIRRAVEWGCQWVVTFDQDSKPAPGMVDALWQCHVNHPRAAVVGPRIVEAGRGDTPYRWPRRHPHWPGIYQRIACHDSDLPEVTTVITSGSMIEVEFWRRSGGFDDRLFIDYVDIDYCLKVIRAGRTCAIARGATLEHRLGARKSARLAGVDFRPMHHPAFRHYYMARNRIVTWRKHALALPHWAMFDFCFAAYNAFRVVAFEAGKWAKMNAMIVGTWDGLWGRGGKCPTKFHASTAPVGGIKMPSDEQRR